MMTKEDEHDLRELQAELVGVEQSPWEPACVARAFCSAAAAVPFVFTLQVWIDLDAAGSPFLLGQMPAAEEAIPRFEEAFLAFGHELTTPEACEPEELILLGEKMLRAIAEGFAMRVKLDPPEGFKAAAGDNGMGDWLPMLACLKSQLGFTLAEARALPVGQAFALIAAHRCNEGWSVNSEKYSTRDVGHGPGAEGEAA
jgi:hypothetical protein